jgi:hypothetical protein
LLLSHVTVNRHHEVLHLVIAVAITCVVTHIVVVTVVVEYIVVVSCCCIFAVIEYIVALGVLTCILLTKYSLGIPIFGAKYVLLAAVV